MDRAELTKQRDELCLIAMRNAPFDGIGWPAYERAALEMGHPGHFAKALFPGKTAEAQSWFSEYADRKMLEQVSALRPGDYRVRERVALCVMERFKVLNPYKDGVRQSMSFMTLPWNKPKAAKLLWTTADKIWVWAGDTATDYNRYSKRGLLSGVLALTQLAWLDDNSKDMQKTREFLDRRIENVLNLGRIVSPLLKKKAAV